MNKKITFLMTLVMCFVFSTAVCLASQNKHDYTVSVESVDINCMNNFAYEKDSTVFDVKSNQGKTVFIGSNKQGMFVGTEFIVENIQPTSDFGFDYKIKLNVKYCDTDRNISDEKFYEFEDNLNESHFIYMPIGSNEYMLYRIVVYPKK